MTTVTKTQTRLYDLTGLERVREERHQASLRGHPYFISNVPQRYSDVKNPWRSTQRGSVIPLKEVPRKLRKWWKDGCPIDPKTEKKKEETMRSEIEKVLRKHAKGSKVKFTLEIE